MPSFKKPAQALFLGVAALIFGIAAPLLFVQEAPLDALQSICGIVLVLGGLALLVRLAAPERDARAPRQAAAGAAQILLGCAILAAHRGPGLGLLAGGILVTALLVSGRMAR